MNDLERLTRREPAQFQRTTDDDAQWNRIETEANLYGQKFQIDIFDEAYWRSSIGPRAVRMWMQSPVKLARLIDLLESEMRSGNREKGMRIRLEGELNLRSNLLRDALHETSALKKSLSDALGLEQRLRDEILEMHRAASLKMKKKRKPRERIRKTLSPTKNRRSSSRRK